MKLNDMPYGYGVGSGNAPNVLLCIGHLRFRALLFLNTRDYERFNFIKPIQKQVL